MDLLRQIKPLVGRITDTHEDDDTAHKLVISMFQLCRPHDLVHAGSSRSPCSARMQPLTDTSSVYLI